MCGARVKYDVEVTCGVAVACGEVMCDGVTGDVMAMVIVMVCGDGHVWCD